MAKKKKAAAPGPGRPPEPNAVTNVGKPLYVKLMPELDPRLDSIIATGKFADRSDFVRSMIKDYPL